MAKNFKGKGKKKSKYTNLERLAYNIARIENGLKKDTKVRDSYNKGLAGKEKSVRKPIC